MVAIKHRYVTQINDIDKNNDKLPTKKIISFTYDEQNSFNNQRNKETYFLKEIKNVFFLFPTTIVFSY